jgi:hypothetical protein
LKCTKMAARSILPAISTRPTANTLQKKPESPADGVKPFLQWVYTVVRP